MSDDVSLPCGACPDKLRIGDRFCPGCGRPVTDEDRAALQARLESSDYQAYERGLKVKNASKWIGVLAIIFAISGVVMFFIKQAQADSALTHLSGFADDEQLAPINGKSYTASELRAEVAREPYQVLLVNVILGVLMGGLWLWSRKAALPAIICAIGLFVVVTIGSALAEPESIIKGWLIKIVAIAMLSKGLKAALESRAIMRPR
jgi:hypothetical protein